MKNTSLNSGVSHAPSAPTTPASLNNLPSQVHPGTLDPVKIVVYVTPKKTVLDPQGTAVEHAMHSLGCKASDVRVGKTIEFSLDGDPDSQGFRDSLDKICNDLLANPVIEDFRYEIHS